MLFWVILLCFCVILGIPAFAQYVIAIAAQVFVYFVMGIAIARGRFANVIKPEPQASQEPVIRTSHVHRARPPKKLPQLRR